MMPEIEWMEKPPKKESDTSLIKDGLSERRPLRGKWERIPGEPPSKARIKNRGEE